MQYVIREALSQRTNFVAAWWFTMHCSREIGDLFIIWIYGCRNFSLKVFRLYTRLQKTLCCYFVVVSFLVPWHCQRQRFAIVLNSQQLIFALSGVTSGTPFREWDYGTHYGDTGLLTPIAHSPCVHPGVLADCEMESSPPWSTRPATHSLTYRDMCGTGRLPHYSNDIH